MYYHFFPNGTVEKIADAEAHARMNTISQQWEDETHKLGKLWLGVHDWAYTGSVIHVPKLRTGGSVPENKIAHSVFGGEYIYGDCFLNANDNQTAAVDKVLADKKITVQDKTATEKEGGSSNEKTASKMTYQKKYENLQKELAEKANTYMTLETEITQVKGFGDVREMGKYMKARSEWQEASNNYWGFLSHLKGKDINPNDEIG